MPKTRATSPLGSSAVRTRSRNGSPARCAVSRGHRFRRIVHRDRSLPGRQWAWDERARHAARVEIAAVGLGIRSADGELARRRMHVRSRGELEQKASREARQRAWRIVWQRPAERRSTGWRIRMQRKIRTPARTTSPKASCCRPEGLWHRASGPASAIARRQSEGGRTLPIQFRRGAPAVPQDRHCGGWR